MIKGEKQKLKKGKRKKSGEGVKKTRKEAGTGALKIAINRSIEILNMLVKKGRNK